MKNKTIEWKKTSEWKNKTRVWKKTSAWKNKASEWKIREVCDEKEKWVKR